MTDFIPFYSILIDIVKQYNFGKQRIGYLDYSHRDHKQPYFLNIFVSLYTY